MRLALIALLLAACTDDGPSSGGPGVTTHVESFQFTSSMSRRCFDGVLADIDPNVAGPQFECSISETVSGVEMVFPQCNNATAPDMSTNRPCWAIEADPQNCPMAETEHLAVVIERTGSAPDGFVNGQCLVQ